MSNFPTLRSDDALAPAIGSAELRSLFLTEFILSRIPMQSGSMAKGSSSG